MQQFLNDHQQGHSTFQMAHLITGKSGCNVFGWYKQTLWELVARWQTLRSAYIEMEIVEAEIEELETEPPTRKTALEIKKRQIGLEHSRLGLRDTEREFAHFYQQAEALKAEYDQLTPEQLAAQECEHWINHARTHVALDLLADDRPSKSTWSLLAAMPQAMREAVKMEDAGRWLLEKSNDTASQYPALQHETIRRIVSQGG